MRRKGWLAIGVLGALALLAVVVGARFAFGSAEVERDTAFIVPSGSTLTAVAHKLEDEGLISSADGFLLRAKLIGGSDPIQAGEFMLPAGIGLGGILETFQHGDVIRRFITIPEGTPSVLVHEKLMAEPLLTGEIPVPEEGSVLPDTYDFERGEARTAVLARMQAAMRSYLAEAWPRRATAWRKRSSSPRSSRRKPRCPAKGEWSPASIRTG